DPDLVLTFSDLQAEIVAELIRRGVAVHAFNQRDLAGIFTMIRTLGALVGAREKAEQLCADLEARLKEVRAAGKRRERRPRIYFEEWDDPMISGIGWVSELIAAAGGLGVFAGRPRRRGEGTGGRPRIRRGLGVGKKFRPRQGRAAARFLRDPRGAARLPARDQISPDPAARAGGADRRARCARRHRRGMERGNRL